MSDEPQPSVIGSLPRTRPHRRSDKRAAPPSGTRPSTPRAPPRRPGQADRRKPTRAAAAAELPQAAAKPKRAPAAAKPRAAKPAAAAAPPTPRRGGTPRARDRRRGSTACSRPPSRPRPNWPRSACTPARAPCAARCRACLARSRRSPGGHNFVRRGCVYCRATSRTTSPPGGVDGGTTCGLSQTRGGESVPLRTVAPTKREPVSSPRRHTQDQIHVNRRRRHAHAVPVLLAAPWPSLPPRWRRRAAARGSRPAARR